MSVLKRCAVAAAPLLVALALSACGGGGGGDAGSGPANPPPSQGSVYFDSTLYSAAANGSLSQANELAAVTQHQIVVGGTPLAYTATAGHLTARHPTSGVQEASFFYVAYTLPNRDPATRP